MTPEPMHDLLARLTPAAPALDRDVLLFEAGRASVRPSRVWPSLAAALTASQLGLLLFVAFPAKPAGAPMAAAPVSVPVAPSAWSYGREAELPPEPAWEPIVAAAPAARWRAAEQALLAE